MCCLNKRCTRSIVSLNVKVTVNSSIHCGRGDLYKRMVAVLNIGSFSYLLPIIFMPYLIHLVWLTLFLWKCNIVSCDLKFVVAFLVSLSLPNQWSNAQISEKNPSIKISILRLPRCRDSFWKTQLFRLWGSIFLLFWHKNSK